ncbi:MAG: hypothetical protein L0Z53_14380 [Acidobacteriales bacterium]|nr:hypothetical protein [Terriglobales bacterium]
MDGGAWEIAWLLREESRRIRHLGKEPPVEWRSGLIYQDGVLLIPVLLRIGKVAAKNIWETWTNHHQRGAESPLPLLAEQERITIHFHDRDLKPDRSIQTFNSLHGFFRMALEQLRGVPAWSMSEFDAAREQVYRQHPDVMELWRALRREG